MVYRQPNWLAPHTEGYSLKDKTMQNERQIVYIEGKWHVAIEGNGANMFDLDPSCHIGEETKPQSDDIIRVANCDPRWWTVRFTSPVRGFGGLRGVYRVY